MKREELLRRVAHLTRLDQPLRVEHRGASFAFGYYSPSGRQFPVLVENFSGEHVWLSDGGETWADLVSEGFASSVPSPSDLARLKSLAEQYRVSWDEKRAKLCGHCSLADVPELARRIVTASIALDGWRLWVQPAVNRQVSIKEIVGKVTHLAPSKGWDVEPKHPLLGRDSGTSWPADALLRRRRDQKNVAVVGSVTFRTTDDVVRHAAGHHADTHTPLVVLCHGDLAAEATRRVKLDESFRDVVMPLGRFASFVDRSDDDASERVIGEADRLAA